MAIVVIQKVVWNHGDISSSGREGSFSHDVVFYSKVVVAVLPSSSGW